MGLSGTVMWSWSEQASSISLSTGARSVGQSASELVIVGGNIAADFLR